MNYNYICKMLLWAICNNHTFDNDEVKWSKCKTYLHFECASRISLTVGVYLFIVNVHRRRTNVINKPGKIIVEVKSTKDNWFNEKQKYISEQYKCQK
jgi:hypothetical protein